MVALLRGHSPCRESNGLYSLGRPRSMLWWLEMATRSAVEASWKMGASFDQLLPYWPPNKHLFSTLHARSPKTCRRRLIFGLCARRHQKKLTAINVFIVPQTWRAPNPRRPSQSGGRSDVHSSNYQMILR